METGPGKDVEVEMPERDLLKILDGLNFDIRKIRNSLDLATEKDLENIDPDKLLELGGVLGEINEILSSAREKREEGGGRFFLDEE